MPPRSDVRERFVVRPPRAVGLGAVLLGLVALAALTIPQEPLAVDLRWSEAMDDIRTPLLMHVALVFNALGRSLGWWLSVSAVAVVLGVARRPRALLAFAAAEGLTGLSSTVLKALVGRPRPPDGLV